MKTITWQQTAKQNEAWEYLNDSTTTELVFGGGAGGGKTRLGVSWLITVCGLYPATRWVMGRSVLKRLKETTLATFFDVCRDWGIDNGKDYSYNQTSGLISWSNGSEILLKDLSYNPSDPHYDSLGSLEVSGAFVDEVSEIQFRAWSVLSTRIRYKLDEYNLTPKLLGSCNPSKNWLYPEFYKPAQSGTLPVHKRFVQALAKDNPFLPKVYLENLRNLKDKNIKERLLHGNWEYDDDPSALFSFQMIQDLFTNTGTKGEKYLTGDIARKGRDRAVLGVWEGLQLQEIIDVPFKIKSDITKLSAYIEQVARVHQLRKSHILLDEDGVGGGAVDMVGCRGFVNNAAPIQPPQAAYEPEKKVNFANLKTQCYYELAKRTANGTVGIHEERPDIRDLISEELEQVKQKDLDKNGKIQLVGKEVTKENIGRSPDFADMIMMRMYYELSPESGWTNYYA